MQIYIDNAASTPISHEVIGTMQESYEHYANPSCAHSMAQKSRELIENARNQIANSIGAKLNEIIFTSGGTESNNLAIKSFVEANSNRGYHIITTAIEHMSVLNPIRYLWNNGYEVTYLPVDNEGKISIQHLRRSIRRNTILISIMYANNEIGTIQAIKEIGDISRRYNICFHTDAVQAFGHCDINVNDLGIDMMSLSGHKIYAPKGVGVLYAKENIKLMPLFHGSGQEYNLRSGTENVSGIIGMGKAVELLDKSKVDYYTMRTNLIDGIKSCVNGVNFNGSIDNGLPNIVNLSFDEVDGNDLLKILNSKGIYASSGSPSLPHLKEPSHVMMAIGVANVPLRISFGRYNTNDDVNYLIDVLPKLVEKLRTK